MLVRLGTAFPCFQGVRRVFAPHRPPAPGNSQTRAPQGARAVAQSAADRANSGSWSNPVRSLGMSVTMRQMLEAGVHFGHQTRYWNPKMAEFIFGQRNKIHIVNLEKTMQTLPGGDEVHAASWPPTRARSCSSAPSARRARSSPRKRAAAACRTSMHRWLGGMLTNFKTVKGVHQAPEGPGGDARRRHVRADEQARGADDAARDGQARRRAWAASRI